MALLRDKLLLPPLLLLMLLLMLLLLLLLSSPEDHAPAVAGPALAQRLHVRERDRRADF